MSFSSSGIAQNTATGSVVENLEILGRLDTGRSAIVDGSMTAVGTSPLITRIGASNAIYSWRVKVSTGGAFGAAQFQYSTDGGTTYSSEIPTSFDNPITPAVENTSPLITRTGTSNAQYSWVVKISFQGALGTARFQYSTNGGSTFSAEITTSASYVVPSTGITLQFPAGNYVANDSWSWTVNPAFLYAVPGTGIGLSFPGGTYVANDSWSWTSSTKIVDVPAGYYVDSNPVNQSPLITTTGPALSLYSWVVRIETDGALGIATFKYSLDGGATFSGPFTTAATYVVSETGLTLNFPAGPGTYHSGDSYRWTSYAGIVDYPPTVFGSSPRITRSGASSAVLAWIIKIDTTPTTFKYSTDGGATYSSSITIPVGGSYVVPGTGITLNFPSGTYNAGDSYAWASHRYLNELGIEILGDSEISLRNLRLGGFKIPDRRGRRRAHMDKRR